MQFNIGQHIVVYSATYGATTAILLTILDNNLLLVAPIDAVGAQWCVHKKQCEPCASIKKSPRTKLDIFLDALNELNISNVDPAHKDLVLIAIQFVKSRALLYAKICSTWNKPIID